MIGIFRSSTDYTPRLMAQDVIDDESMLVQVMAWCRPSGNKPLPEPMLTQISVAMWRH